MSNGSSSDRSAFSIEFRRLLADAKSGDAAAREVIFERCRNYVAVVARSQIESYLAAKVDSSDLIQQSLLEAHRGFDNFQGASEGEWLAWLKQIVLHNAADVVRHYALTEKRKVAREVPLAAPTDGSTIRGDLQLSTGGETPSQVVMRDEDALMLSEAIADLPPDYQEVIRLRNIVRLPFDEVAERMGRSRGAVQMLWMRALDALRKSCREREPDRF